MSKKKKGLVVLIVIVVVTAAIITSKAIKLSSTKKLNVDQEILESVAEVVLLPNEAPQFATVSNVNQLKEQVFFKDAQNNDRVIIFPQAAKAILYRPSIDRVINIGPVTLEQPTTQDDKITDEPEVGDSVDPTPTISDAKDEEVKSISTTLLNGSPTKGVTHDMEKVLKKNFDNITVSEKATAKKDNYEKSLILVNSNVDKLIIENLAREIKAEITQELTDEKTYQTDLVIVIGNNFEF